MKRTRTVTRKNKIKYTCSECGREVGKLNLKVKKFQFKEMGENGAVIKSRVASWLCVVPQEDGSPGCLHKDPDWNRPLHATSPGMRGTAIEARS
jgi:hypothetical protein